MDIRGLFPISERAQFRLSENYLDLNFGKTEIAARMEPASSIIRKVGGEAVVSRITKTAYTAPYRWQYPRDRGGTDGVIPQRHHRTLLDYARSEGIRLTADEFLPMRSRRARSRAA